ncbi:hypothetical protein POM88_052618 [Heracleum sosnowskyi]|uniref:Uncharacterized protein n=1 Tax=Heracleum sosnowskyi TaxID=360622 RepID=A0AAD8GRD0_9APIA|nr:hypothetical protein POM88_052618 [Heracleum sosnowskyi]
MFLIFAIRVAFAIVPKGVIFPLSGAGEEVGRSCVVAKEADFLVQNKALYGDKEQLSQIQDYDISNIKESSASGKLIDWHDEEGFPAENPSPEIVDQVEAAPHFQASLIPLK